jgi:hypothetical protein
MGGDETMRGVRVGMFAPTLGENIFLLRLQHRETPDFIKIAGQAVIACENG